MTLLLDTPAFAPSPLSRLDARWRLAALLVAAASVALLQTPWPALSATAGALVLVAVARLPLRWFVPRLGIALLVPAFLVVWLPFVHRPGDAMNVVYGATVSITGLLRAVTLLAKAASIVTVMLVLFAAAPVQDTLKAAQALRAPGWLVHLVLLSYRYVFLLAAEFGQLRMALRVRGYRNRVRLHSYRTVGQVAGTLLVRGHERAERVGQAMRCRGFDGQLRSLHAFQTHRADVRFFVLATVAAGGLLTWDVWDRW